MAGKLSSWRSRLPEGLQQYAKLNWYRVHLLYFIFVILLASVIMYGSTTNGNSGDAEATFYLRYIDALLLCASAMTNTGLNPVNLGSITAFQQAILFILIPMGNVMIVSTSTIYLRKYWFKKRMGDFLQHSKAGQAVVEDIERQQSGQGGQSQGQTKAEKTAADSTVPRDNEATSVRQRKRQAKIHHEYDHGGYPFPWQSSTFQNVLSAPLQSRRNKPHDQPHDYLSFRPSLDSRGRFHSLDERQREELGGVEYKALHLLGWLLPAYFLFWLALGIVILVPYSYRHNTASIVRGNQPGNLDPGWWAAFTIMSGFGNCGLNLLDANMTPFYNDYLVLIVAGAMILVGNQLFPVFLRLIIWTMFKLVPKNSELHHTCAFLLHHPRRCFFLLFPSINTWYLLAAQLGIDAVLWAFFGILNIGLDTVQGVYTAGEQTIMGLFQAIGTRVGGFYVILLSDIAPAMQVLLMIAMYISGFPQIISIRQTNIYEERSVGLEAPGGEEEDAEKTGEKSYAATHIRKQLAYDIWWLALAVWLICIIERGQIVGVYSYFSVFSILFEVVSAYGTVGLSLGVPFDDYSFCGVWHTLSKLILIAVMIRGRHRGLPFAIDRAVLLPGEETMERMDKEMNSRGGRRGTDWNQEEKRVRREEEGSQAENQEQGQDPDEDEKTKAKFAGSTEEGPS